MTQEKPRKLANAVAIAIEQDILARRIAIGEPLGTEAELCQRYGVSRWAIREAIAIVQNDGLISIRRGRSGGAVVAATPEQSLAAAICGFLLYARMKNEHIVEWRTTLERLMFEEAALAPHRAVPDRARQLLSGTGTAIDMFSQTIALSGVGITSVLVMALSKLTLCRLVLLGGDDSATGGVEVSSQALALRREQLRAFAALDADAAAQASTDLARIFESLFVQHSSTPLIDIDAARSWTLATSLAEILRPGQGVKRAGVVSTMLMLDVVSIGPANSGLLGSEVTLAARYGVPRNLLREGIRILERDGFIRPEQGRTGGIRVGEPDISEIVARTIRLVEFLCSSDREILALARECRMNAIELVVADDEAASAVASEICRLGRATGTALPSNELFLLLAKQTGNSFLLFVELVCSRLLPQTEYAPAQNGLLEAIASALQARDVLQGRRAIASFHGRGI